MPAASAAQFTSAPPSMSRLVISNSPSAAITLRKSGRPSDAEEESPSRIGLPVPVRRRTGMRRTLSEYGRTADALVRGICMTRMPRASKSRFFFSSAKAHNTSTSFCAVFTMREASGKRRRESKITRSSGRRRARPVRSVSSGSSATTVPTPTMMASLA